MQYEIDTLNYNLKYDDFEVKKIMKIHKIIWFFIKKF
jgi:hypothetical protein